MIQSSTSSRQPKRQAWTCERLLHERAIALGNAIDNLTWKAYGSALNSYFEFTKLHDFNIEPTPDTLSLFTVYMCHHIKPDSVDSYLSGICQQLETYFPDVHNARKSPLVQRTLRGCKHLRGSPTTRKCALTLDDLEIVLHHYTDPSSHDDLLFMAMLLTHRIAK